MGRDAGYRNSVAVFPYCDLIPRRNNYDLRNTQSAASGGDYTEIKMVGDLPEDLKSHRVVSTRAACELIGVSHDTLERLHDANEAPPRFRVGIRRFGHRVADLEKWLKVRAVRSDAA
jgi:predicted DNA-binding transcriptional regulator AlpA